MKKVIAILLVVLVAGVMFGADTLTINSTAASIMKHGFSDEAFTSFGGIVSGDVSATATKAVNLGSADSQSLGYYSIATNTKDSLAISVSAGPMKSEELVTDDAFYYIPYTLSFKHGSEDAITGTHDFFRGALASAPTDLAITLKTDSYITGTYWKSFAMDLTFGNFMVDGGLDVPEGDYSSTVTITVTTT